jgi:hypothetical protein
MDGEGDLGPLPEYSDLDDGDVEQLSPDSLAAAIRYIEEEYERIHPQKKQKAGDADDALPSEAEASSPRAAGGARASPSDESHSSKYSFDLDDDLTYHAEMQECSAADQPPADVPIRAKPNIEPLIQPHLHGWTAHLRDRRSVPHGLNTWAGVEPISSSKDPLGQQWNVRESKGKRVFDLIIAAKTLPSIPGNEALSVQVAAFGHHSFASKLMTQEFDKDSMPTTNVLSRAMPTYTILKDGHPVSVEDGEKPLEQGAAFIAVPQKIRILINVERSVQALHELSAPIDGKVADLKHALSSRRIIDFPAAEALIHDLRGNLLQDPSLLSASYNFSPSCCRLTCTRKVNQTGGPVAADLERQWQTVDAAAEVSDRLQERLQSAVSSTLASEGGKGLEAEEELQTSSYDAFTRRLPAATHPPTAPPASSTTSRRASPPPLRPRARVRRWASRLLSSSRA